MVDIGGNQAENAGRDLKDKLHVLLQKSDNDDKLIDGLSIEVETLKKSQRDQAPQQPQNYANEENTRVKERVADHKTNLLLKKLASELKKYKAISSQLVATNIETWELNEKEQRIDALNAELEKKDELLRMNAVKVNELEDKVNLLGRW